MVVVGITYGYFLKSFVLGAEVYWWQQFRQLFGVGVGYLSGNLEHAAQCADMLPQPMPSGLHLLTLLSLVLPAARGCVRAIRG